MGDAQWQRYAANLMIVMRPPCDFQPYDLLAIALILKHNMYPNTKDT
jgi:hypothetical protein